MQTTMYEVKHIPLQEYQKQLWRNPAYQFDAISLILRKSSRLNAASGGSAMVAAAGTDSNVSLWLAPQAYGTIILADQHNGRILVAQGGSNNPLNYLTVSNSGINVAPALTTTGSDTNINVQINPKGTGSLDVNSHSIINVTDPVNPQDAVTLHYTSNNLAVIRLLVTRLLQYLMPLD